MCHQVSEAKEEESIIISPELRVFICQSHHNEELKEWEHAHQSVNLIFRCLQSREEIDAIVLKGKVECGDAD